MHNFAINFLYKTVNLKTLIDRNLNGVQVSNLRIYTSYYTKNLGKKKKKKKLAYVRLEPTNIRLAQSEGGL